MMIRNGPHSWRRWPRSRFRHKDRRPAHSAGAWRVICLHHGLRTGTPFPGVPRI